MTLNEFYNEFNLVYNNLMSNQAPGLDKYEISVYLTKAQEALTDALYEEFEQSEEARRKLAPLVDTIKLDTVIVPNSKIIYPEYTTTYQFVPNVRYIINEQVKMGSKADKCVRGKFIDVQPCLHDEIDSYIQNPFKFNVRRALRLDTSNDGDTYIEILTKTKPIEYYQIRYVKNPNPIILEDLGGTDSINGIQTATNASLPDTVHRRIVEIAARLAYNDYKQ